MPGSSFPRGRRRSSDLAAPDVATLAAAPDASLRTARELDRVHWSIPAPQVIMWTLLIFLAVGGDSIVIDGFTNARDCAALGYLNVHYVQVVPNVQYRCTKTGRPPVRCFPDRRTYGRTAECITSTGVES